MEFAELVNKEITEKTQQLSKEVQQLSKEIQEQIQDLKTLMKENLGTEEKLEKSNKKVDEVFFLFFPRSLIALCL